MQAQNFILKEKQEPGLLALPPCQQRLRVPRALLLHRKVLSLFLLCPQGPLSVFSAKNKWYPVRRVHLRRGENGFGFTLRGDSPVLIAGVIPGGCAAVSTRRLLEVGTPHLGS